MERFRGRLAFTAHRLLYHSRVGSRVIEKKKKKKRERKGRCCERQRRWGVRFVDRTVQIFFFGVEYSVFRV